MKKTHHQKHIGIITALLLAAILTSCALSAGPAAGEGSRAASPAGGTESMPALSGHEAAGSGTPATEEAGSAASSEVSAAKETGAETSCSEEAGSEDSETAETADGAAEGEPEMGPSFAMPETIADLKAMDLSNIPYITPEMTDILASRIVRSVPGNDYDLSAFRKEDGFIVYEAEGYECLRGIDVSSHQGEIDWAAVRAAGIDFVMIRAGFRGYGESGSLNEDGMFRTNLAGARKAGLAAGAYFFSQAINEEEAALEADFVLGILDGEELDLPLVFDTEHIRGDEARTDSVRLSQFTKNALAFCRKVEEAGYAPMIYTNLLWEALVYDMEALSEYPVWYAGYDPVPVTPYRFDLWQYSESGTVPGIEGPVDLDLWIRKAAP